MMQAMKTEFARIKPNAEAPRTWSGTEKFFLTQRRKDAKARTRCGALGASASCRQDAGTPRLPCLASLRLCAFAFILLPLCLSAVTNDLLSAATRLFEEEANHNLEARRRPIAT
jgi:hypothetical protein